MLHMFRFDQTAVAVPPRGNPLGRKYRHGAWTCVMCRALLTFCVQFDLDHADDCPGSVIPAAQIAVTARAGPQLHL
jgi:hypothetical protein